MPTNPLNQSRPQDLPSPSSAHPAPWTCASAGNGHYYVDDASGRPVAHVYCWDDADHAALTDRLKAANQARPE